MGQHLWLPGGLFEGQISYFFFLSILLRQNFLFVVRMD